MGIEVWLLRLVVGPWIAGEAIHRTNNHRGHVLIEIWLTCSSVLHQNPMLLTPDLLHVRVRRNARMDSRCEIRDRMLWRECVWIDFVNVAFLRVPVNAVLGRGPTWSLMH